jgi:phytoene dehydrogenase-like protein
LTIQGRIIDTANPLRSFRLPEGAAGKLRDEAWSACVTLKGSAVSRACVIGAGSSGLAVIKALADRGIDFDCFERSDRVGGNWVYGNANGMSSAYRSLRTNSSRTRTQYAVHPMPPDYPDFPHHTEMARYFEGYADRFGLTRHITFNTTVVHARREAGAWLRRMLTKELAPSGSRSGRAVTPSRSGQNGLKKWLAQQ